MVSLHKLTAFSPARDFTMRHYKQLTYAQRCQIAVLKKSGFTQQSIAELTNYRNLRFQESFLEIQVSEVTDTNKLMSGLCFAEEV